MTLGTLHSGESHASLDSRSRLLKARKIEILLGLETEGAALDILEIGTGAGVIAHYFATSPRGHRVRAVDVQDNRILSDGFEFRQVTGTDLPYSTETFDLVISNHVIEHVGDAAAQEEHLREAHRVLRPSGRLYLAVPNRWQIIEPHYGIAFLSWLPRGAAGAYLRACGRGDTYDCRPLSRSGAEETLARTGFEFTQRGGEAIRATCELEKPGSWLYRRVVSRVPEALFRRFRGCIPTLIFIARPDRRGASATGRTGRPQAPPAS